MLEETVVAMHVTKVVIIIIHGGTFTVPVSADLIGHAGTSHAEYIAARGKGGRASGCRVGKFYPCPVLTMV